jgi:hypothetical protein
MACPGSISSQARWLVYRHPTPVFPASNRQWKLLRSPKHEGNPHSTSCSTEYELEDRVDVRGITGLNRLLMATLDVGSQNNVLAMGNEAILSIT